MSNNISCIIVDDEPAALNQLVRYAEKTPFLDLLGAFNNPLEALAFINENKTPDLVLLDIQMPDLTGMELSKVLPPDTAIIFTTAFNEYAIDGYKVNALDYLLKPIDYTEFLVAVSKAKSKKETTLIDEGKNDYVFLKSEYHQLKVVFSDILYIEGMKDYVKVYLESVPKPILSLISLKRLEEVLPSDKFMRIHRSYIIGLDKIEQIERGQVIIQDVRITISEQYRPVFTSFMNSKSL